MKIVKCSKCGKYIYEDIKCFCCGNKVNFEEIDIPKLEIHENVLDKYSEIESLIKDREFERALIDSEQILEWMPHFSEIFWLRLLAKKECASASELVEKGFDYENDPDFCNALRFSGEIENNIYLNIQDRLIQVKKRLEKEILNHESSCKMQTNILQIQDDARDEAKKSREILYIVWRELQKTEKDLYSLEKDCYLLSKEHSIALDEAAKTADLIKKEVYNLGECTQEDFYKYQIKINHVLWQSEQAKEEKAEIRKQNLWVKSFNDLVNKRDKQVKEIEKEISSLKSYEIKIQNILEEIDRIEGRHREAIYKVQDYNFLDALNLLGKEYFNTVLYDTDAPLDIQISVPSENIKKDLTLESVHEDKNKDVDDYYSNWAVNNDDQ